MDKTWSALILDDDPGVRQSIRLCLEADHARVLGVGTSAAYPSAMRIFRVQADQLGMAPPRMAMATLSLAAISTQAFGPALGGFITGVFGWHAIFSVNVPLALITGFAVFLLVPRDVPRTTGLRELVREIDIPGVVLFAAALLSLEAVDRSRHPGAVQASLRLEP